MKLNNTVEIQRTARLVTRAGLVFVSLGLMLWQSSARAEDLMQIYQLAKQHDATYAAAQASWAAQQEKVVQARATLKPNVQLSASTAHNSTDTTFKGPISFPGGKQKFNTTAYGVTLRQPLYNKQDWEQLNESQLLVKQADAKLKLAQQDLILRVAQAYFDTLIVQDNLVFVGAQKKAIAKQLQQAKRKFEVGSNTITDVDEAQARYDLVVANEIAAKNAVLVKNRSLAKLTGEAPSTLATLDAQWQPSVPEPADESKWLLLTRQGNMNVLIQRAAYEIAEKEIQRQRGYLYPTLDLVAGYQKSSTNGNASFGIGSDVTDASIGLQLSVPIYSGGAANSRDREAIHNKEAASYQLEDAVRSAKLGASQAYLGVFNGVAQVKAFNQAVLSNQNLLKSSERGWQLGTGTAVDVLNAQQQLYSAKRDLQQAKYSTLLSQLQLNASVGNLKESDLKKINDQLIEQ